MIYYIHRNGNGTEKNKKPLSGGKSTYMKKTEKDIIIAAVQKAEKSWAFNAYVEAAAAAGNLDINVELAHKQNHNAWHEYIALSDLARALGIDKIPMTEETAEYWRRQREAKRG